MYRTFKRKLILTCAQQKRIDQWIGVCRMVYNLGLEIKIESYKKVGKSPSTYDLNKQITDLRAEYEWVNEVPRNTIDDTMFRLESSYKMFFKGFGFPKWAKKGKYNSITFRDYTHHSLNSIKLPKIGKLKLVKDKGIDGKILFVIVKKEPTGYFAHIRCEIENKYKNHESFVGIDMGISKFASLSNGEQIDNPRHFKNYERKLRIENRSLSRKKKGSNNWKKQAKRLSLFHHKIANVRKDFLHKQSTLIAKEYGTVYMENLNVAGMSKNRRLSKNILDCGWTIFKTYLEYKTNVISINPAYTSQTCHECKAVDKKSRISQSEYVCTSCGNISNADINAAQNIKHQGMVLNRQREAIACA